MTMIEVTRLSVETVAQRQVLMRSTVLLNTEHLISATTVFETNRADEVVPDKPAGSLLSVVGVSEHLHVSQSPSEILERIERAEAVSIAKEASRVYDI